MKNRLFSFIWPLIALFLGTQTISNTHSKSDSKTPSIVKMAFDCCGGDIDDPIFLGDVRNSSQQGISGATVTVYDSNGSSVGSTLTDSNGQFGVQVIPGDYYFVIDASGYCQLSTSTYDLTVDQSDIFILQ